MKCDFCGGELRGDERYILAADKHFCEECVNEMSVAEFCEEVGIRNVSDLCYELDIDWRFVPSMFDFKADEAYAMIVDELFERRDERCAI